MAMYQPDLIASIKISNLRQALSESEQKRFKLERRVSDLDSLIEKITGYGPEYVQHITEQYRSSVANTRRAAEAAEQEHKQRLEKFEAQIRRELDRYLTAKKMAEFASDEARQLEAARTSLTSDVVAIVRGASEDNSPFLLQPNVQGVGVDLVKLFRWVKAKMRCQRSSEDT